MAKIYDSTGKAMLDVTTVDEQSWKKRLQDKLDEFSPVLHIPAYVDLNFRTFDIVETGGIKRIDATGDFIADITANDFRNIFAEFKATPAPTLANMVPQELMQEWVGAGYTIESNVRFFRKKNKYLDSESNREYPQWSRYNKYDENGDRHMCFSVPGTGNVECPVGEVIPDDYGIDVINHNDFVPGLFGHQLNYSTDGRQIWLPLLRGVATMPDRRYITGITIKPRGNLFRKSDSWSSYGDHITLFFYQRYRENGEAHEKGLESSYARGCIHIPCAFAQEFVVKDTEGKVVFEMASRKVKGAIKVTVPEELNVDIEERNIYVNFCISFEQEL